MNIQVNGIHSAPSPMQEHAEKKQKSSDPLQSLWSMTRSEHAEVPTEQLASFLVSTLQAMLFGADMPESRKGQLKVLLENSKVILSPSRTLQFYRHLSRELLSDRSSFEYSSDGAPSLPLPLATSWIPKAAFTVNIPNPVLRACFRGIMVPNEYQSDYLLLFQGNLHHAIKAGVEKVQKMTFSQLNTSYEFSIKPWAILFLFFPGIIAQAGFGRNGHILDLYSKILFSDYAFTMSDRRLDARLEGKAKVLESLIATDNLGLFPEELLAMPGCKKALTDYLAFLVHYGVIESEELLPKEIIKTIFSLSVQLLKNEKEECSLTSCLHEACLRPEVRAIVSTMPEFPFPAPNSVKKPVIEQSREDSFLLRALYPATNEPEPVANRVNFDRTKSPNDLARIIAEKVIEGKKGLHLVVCPNDCSEWVLLDQVVQYGQFSPLHEAWKEAVKSFSKEQLLPDFCRQVNHGNYGTFLLGLVPFFHEVLVQNVFLSQVTGATRYRVTEVINIFLSKLEHDHPQAHDRFWEAISFAANSVQHWVSPEHIQKHKDEYKYIDDHKIFAFIERFNELKRACETRQRISLLLSALRSCFQIPKLHCARKTFSELFFIQFLLAGHVAAMQLQPCEKKPTYTKEMLERVINFAPTDILKSADFQLGKIKPEEFQTKGYFLINHIYTLPEQLNRIRALKIPIASITLYGSDDNLEAKVSELLG